MHLPPKARHKCQQQSHRRNQRILHHVLLQRCLLTCPRPFPAYWVPCHRTRKMHLCSHFGKWPWYVSAWSMREKKRWRSSMTKFSTASLQNNTSLSWSSTMISCKDALVTVKWVMYLKDWEAWLSMHIWTTDLVISNNIDRNCHLYFYIWQVSTIKANWKLPKTFACKQREWSTESP